MEFDPGRAPEEGAIIWYFWQALKSLVKVEMEQRGRKLNSFDEIVEKTFNTEAKASLKPCSYICEIDQWYIWGNYSTTI